MSPGGSASSGPGRSRPPGLAGELAGLLPCSVLLPVRDPRDAFPSVVSFVGKRGAPGFGMRPGRNPEELAPRSVALQRRRLQEVARAQRTGSATVMRYEDLVADLPGQALRLGSLLGTTPEPAGAGTGRVHYHQHSTTISPNESVGRWRREMDPRTRALSTASSPGSWNRSATRPEPQPASGA